jgi:predicted HTH transcriptional regulator
MINNGEGLYSEFKSTLRVNLHTMQRDAKMEHAVLKTINGFLNSRDGGNLVIGISDDGSPIGLDADEFLNEDKMDLHLGNLIKDRLGADTMLHIKPRFEDYKDKRVYIVECLPSQKPIYMKNGNEEEFYIRAGGSSSKLSTSQIVDYIKQRYPNN